MKSYLVKLHRVNLAAVNLRYPDIYGKPIIIKWLWRPVIDGKDLLSNLKVRKNSAEYQLLNSQLYYGIRVLVNHSLVYEKYKDVNSTSVISNKLFSNIVNDDNSNINSTVDWCNSHMILYDFPLQGEIEIVIGYKSEEIVNDKRKLIVIEAIDLTINELPMIESYPIASDNNDQLLCNAIVPTFNSIIGKVSSIQINNAVKEIIGRDKKIMRIFTWNNDTSSIGKLKFSMKLISEVNAYNCDEAGTGNSFNSSAPFHNKKRNNTKSSATDIVEMEEMKLESLSYSYSIYVYGCNASIRKVLDNTYVENTINRSTSVEDVMSNSNSNGNNNSNSNILPAWSWKSYETELSNLHCGDQIILASKPLSNLPSYPKNYLQQVSVLVKDCTLFTTDPMITKIVRKYIAEQNDELDENEADQSRDYFGTMLFNKESKSSDIFNSCLSMNSCDTSGFLIHNYNEDSDYF